MGAPQSHSGTKADQDCTNFIMWLPGLPSTLGSSGGRKNKIMKTMPSFENHGLKVTHGTSAHIPQFTTSHVAPFLGKEAGKYSPLLGSWSSAIMLSHGGEYKLLTGSQPSLSQSSMKMSLEIYFHEENSNPLSQQNPWEVDSTYLILVSMV